MEFQYSLTEEEVNTSDLIKQTRKFVLGVEKIIDDIKSTEMELIRAEVKKL